MANDYFKFKQFTIRQDKCAMKVCTDTCLFGAFIAGKKLPGYSLLDIGTGTGILPLMLVQKNNELAVDAVEIDTEAALQATENIAASPWKDRIRVINEDVLSLKPKTLYDCIISNPPFFENDLLSDNVAVNNARHDTSLNLSRLLEIVDSNLAEHGNFAVLIPYQRIKYFIDKAAKNGFFPVYQLLVKQTIKHKFFRAILIFKREQKTTENKEIIIKELENNYTTEFSSLLKDYYLFL